MNAINADITRHCKNARKEFDERFKGCKKSSVLDNAEYRRAYIDTSKGYVEKFYLNVNCKDAEILKYEWR